MEINVQDISQVIGALSEAQKDWKIPDEYFPVLENCSLQLEHLYEGRYERLKADLSKIKEFLQKDKAFAIAFQEETHFLHTTLWIIDSFHVGVRGFDHVFWHMANSCLELGVENSIVEHFFDPDTNQFDPNLNPLPPPIFHSLDNAGDLHSSKDGFDRSSRNSIKWNFYHGLRSPRVDQQERFRALYERLEYTDDILDEDDTEDHEEQVSKLGSSWDDAKNEPVLSALEEVAGGAGRPKNPAKDDRYAVMYAKILMLRYIGDELIKTPSRHSCIMRVAEFLNVAEHNRPAFHRRIDRKLKEKMSLRNIRQ